MRWKDVRQAFPNQWVLIEAIQAHTDENNERILDDVAPLKKFPTSPKAMKAYQEIHQLEPNRELYVLHTNRSKPNIINKNRQSLRFNRLSV